MLHVVKQIRIIGVEINGWDCVNYTNFTDGLTPSQYCYIHANKKPWWRKHPHLINRCQHPCSLIVFGFFFLSRVFASIKKFWTPQFHFPRATIARTNFLSNGSHRWFCTPSEIRPDSRFVNKSTPRSAGTARMTNPHLVTWYCVSVSSLRKCISKTAIIYTLPSPSAIQPSILLVFSCIDVCLKRTPQNRWGHMYELVEAQVSFASQSPLHLLTFPRFPCRSNGLGRLLPCHSIIATLIGSVETLLWSSHFNLDSYAF